MAREWLRAFTRFLWRRFVEDRCFESAAVLAFGTTLALVPLSTAVFGILSAFPVFDAWSARLTGFLFTHFVPGAARTVEAYLQQFTASASQLTWVGLAAVFLSALLIMKGVEDTFNRIWRVITPRHGGARLLMYWVVLTLGPLLAAASMALSSWLFEESWWQGTDAGSNGPGWLAALPLLVEWLAFTLAYQLIPNRVVRFTHAAAGGVLATVLFESAKSGLGWYLGSVPSYQQIYGALAAVPIFLLWLYLSWAVVLLGASVAASLSAFRFQPSSALIPAAASWLSALRICGRFVRAQRMRTVLRLEALRDLEPGIDDALLNGMLDQLTEAGVLQRNDDGAWLLACDPGSTSLQVVYDALAAHLPLRPWHGPGSDDALGLRATGLIEEQAAALCTSLERPLGTLGEFEAGDTHA